MLNVIFLSSTTSAFLALLSLQAFYRLYFFPPLSTFFPPTLSSSSFMLRIQPRLSIIYAILRVHQLFWLAYQSFAELFPYSSRPAEFFVSAPLFTDFMILSYLPADLCCIPAASVSAVLEQVSLRGVGNISLVAVALIYRMKRSSW